MKAHLMYRNADFHLNVKLCYGKDTLIADLELTNIIATMSKDDMTIQDVCVAALFQPLQTIQEIKYRQDILLDCMNNPEIVRKLYDVTVETIKRKQSSWSWVSTSQYLSSNFTSAINLLKIYTEMLRELRNASGSNTQNFRSEGFKNLIAMLWRELDDHYFAEISVLLNELKESDGTLISAKLGSYIQGVDYVLRRKQKRYFWRRWHFAPSYSISSRDDAGGIDLGARRNRAINESTNVLAQSVEHVMSFFATVQRELAFYVGCLNLHDQLKAIGMPVCIPRLLPQESERRSYDALYDVSLALEKHSAVVGNGLIAEGKRLYLITGANQGGKSTFLRSIGQAQLMMQCGMFVGAINFLAPIRNVSVKLVTRLPDA